ncbi:transmembrane protein 116-like [Falco peregrinus]|uniref:transmembrane protein 116-like n=1 Tax=Falco peregrinus TaxID=8954 RepID=UPI00247A95E1|nr:transmembrane protein 116-like [Falco peregrinus]
MQQGKPLVQPAPRGPSHAAAPQDWRGTNRWPHHFAHHQRRASAPGHSLLGKTLLPQLYRLHGDTLAPATRCCFSQGRPREWVHLCSVSSHAVGQLRLPLWPRCRTPEPLPSTSLLQVFVLTCIYLPASLLSLLGSGSVLAVTSWQRQCCHIQLRPLFLLALADFLAAAVLLSTATIQLLPAPLFILAYAACPYGLMLATTFYAVSFLMVVVYAYEAYRTVQGWRAWHVAALQERSRCLESMWQGLPYILAWLVPALTLLGQLIARGTSFTDIAPRHMDPIVPWKGNSSHETYSLYCSSCLLLIHRAQDICYKYVGRKDVGLEEKIIFFLYLLLVLSCCTLLYHRVKLWCRRNAAAPLLTLEKDGFAGRSIRSVTKISHYFQLVFLLCWAPAFLLTLLSFTSIKPASVFVLYVATALTVSLQGFLHSLVYGWLRQNFRQEVVGKRPSLQHQGLRAYYDESLGAVP